MKVFIIILNFNGREFILQCLDSVKKLEIACLPARQGNWKLEIVVVDNVSTDDSVALIKQNYPDLRLLVNKENLGFAEGNNVGIRYALENGADFVLILNPDTIVDKDLIVQLIEVAKTNSKIGIVGPKIYFAPGYEFHKAKYKTEARGKVIWYAGGLMDWQNVLASHRGVDEVDQGQYNKIQQTDFVSGCAMLVKKEVFAKIGLFDPKYFLYWEDNDFCQRARKAGFEIVFAPQAKMFHLNAGSSVSGGPLQEYYITRNRLLFGMRYAPLRAKLAIIKESLKLLLTGRKWQRIGVKDFCFGKFAKGSWK